MSATSKTFSTDSLSVGHKGKYGHEFLEFEFRPNGRMRYANNSNYKSETLIRKEGKPHLPHHCSIRERVRPR